MRRLVVVVGLAVAVQAGSMLPNGMAVWSDVTAAAEAKCLPENCPPPPPGADAPKKCLKLYEKGKYGKYASQCVV
jgi:hypothetical protein